ncbi:MAG: exodeoxyribonuclease VII large subunit [Bacteroidales bacterium]
MAEQALSLLDLQKKIKSAVEKQLDAYYWVVGEISDMAVNYKGHCYMNLVQKDEDTDHILAKIRTIIWANHFRMLSTYFKSQAKETLNNGFKVMFKVRVNYHVQYGLSLQVVDIDPTYTIGDVEKRRKEIIAQLEQAGITDMNKMLDLPLVIHNIAVISSDTAAGFGDFVAQMETNPEHYAFNIELFRAAMQGEDTEQSVVQALKAIFDADTLFDVVVIIRGGGDKTDLSWFDNYNIASHVAQFPVPVFSGIGHERDKSVTDMVAHTHLKTPTAVAETIINHNRGFEEGIDRELETLLRAVRQYMDDKKQRLNMISRNFIPLVKTHINDQENALQYLYNKLYSQNHQVLNSHKQKLDHLSYQLSSACKTGINLHKEHTNKLYSELKTQCKDVLTREQHRMERYQDKIHAEDPIRLLNKGYSMTSKNGKLVKYASQLIKGDVINTKFKDGDVDSEVL